MQGVVELRIVDLTKDVEGSSDSHFEEEVLAAALDHCEEVSENVVNNRTCWIYPSFCLRSRATGSDKDARSVNSRHQESVEMSDSGIILQCLLKEKLLRYVRLKDRYLNLTSLLLKSETFHRHLEKHCDEGVLFPSRRPVVDLPRTQYGKPFVPGDDAPIFSVSHQFPFVGTSLCMETVDGLKLGMDIVMFDGRNEKLYETDMDFCRVFESSFSPMEWSNIEAAEDSLREFYLRWSIKEAYTKALGVGMGMEFSSFDMVIDDCKHGSLWEYVHESGGGRSMVEFKGRILPTANDGIIQWRIWFVPLRTLDQQIKGCSCICATCVDGLATNLLFNPVTLSQLIRYHQPKQP